MNISAKGLIILTSSLLVMVSLACGMPFGLDIGGSGTDGSETQTDRPDEVAQEITSTPTRTPSPTPTNTNIPTDTPEPTPTATLVVRFTITPSPTPVRLSSNAPVSASGGGEGPVIDPATGLPAADAGTDSTQTNTSTSTGGTVLRAAIANPVNVLVNSDFEAEWDAWHGVAPGWTPFDNGTAHFGWYNDTWFKVVYNGEQAQLIEIINSEGQGDRYAGIYQTVSVVPGAEYEFTINGLVRSDEGSQEASGGGYVLQYGFDLQGGNDWTLVTEWVSLPFPEYPREDPTSNNEYNYGTHTAKVIPTTNKLTVYIRGWKKWADFNEGNFDIDTLVLKGTGKYPSGSVQTVAVATNTPAPEEPTLVPAEATATPTQGATVVSEPTLTLTPTTQVVAQADTPTPTATPPAPPTPTPTPSIAATPTPAGMPTSGGEPPVEGPAKSILIISLLSLALLLGGAVFGVIRPYLKSQKSGAMPKKPSMAKASPSPHKLIKK